MDEEKRSLGKWCVNVAENLATKTKGLYISAGLCGPVCDLYCTWKNVYGSGALHPLNNAKANAEFICKAVNNHDQLVSALNKAEPYLMDPSAWKVVHDALLEVVKEKI